MLIFKDLEKLLSRKFASLKGIPNISHNWVLILYAYNTLQIFKLSSVKLTTQSPWLKKITVLRRAWFLWLNDTCLGYLERWQHDFYDFETSKEMNMSSKRICCGELCWSANCWRMWMENNAAFIEWRHFSVYPLSTWALRSDSKTY